MGQIALIQGNVLDSYDPFVRLQLGDAIHQQKRIAMRQDVLDNGVVERQAQRIHGEPSIIRLPAEPAAAQPTDD